MDETAKLNNARQLAIIKPKLIVRLVSISNDDVGSTATTSNFEVKVPYMGQVVEARLVSTAFVNSQFPVFSGNNKFVLRTFTTAGSITTDTTITITPGVYDGTSLATALQTALNVVVASGFTVTFSSTTQYFTFTRIDGLGTFALRLGTDPASMAEVLGFARSNQTLATSQVSTYPAQLGGPLVMKIRCDQLNNMDTPQGDRYFAEIQWSDQFSVRHINTFVSNAKLFPSAQVINRLTFQFENATPERTAYEINNTPFRIGIEFIAYA